MRMLVQFGQVLGIGIRVQLGYGVLVVVCRLFAWGMRVTVRVLVGVHVLMGMGVDRSIRMPVLMRMGMRVNVRVRVVVFNLGRHDIVLLSRVRKNPTALALPEF